MIRIGGVHMVKVISIDKTLYDDGSVWLLCEHNSNYYSCELRYPEDILNPIDEDKIVLDNLKCKDLVKDIWDFDDSIVYIDEEDDVEFYRDCLDNILVDLKKYPELENFVCITDYECNNTITIYGDIITKILFPKNG